MVLLSSCMVGPDFQPPGANIQPRWRKYDSVTDRPATLADGEWWKSFQDPTLNRCIERAYRNNPTLQAAGVRILQARAELNTSIGELFPQRQEVLLGARSNVTSNPDNTWTPFGLSDNYVAGTALLSVSWEIDFWGKYRRQIESDRAGYLATIAAYDDVLVTLIADVANTYTNIRALQRRIDILRKNVSTQRRSLELARGKYQAGRVSSLDVDQAGSQLASAEAGIPPLEDARQRALHGLATLMGDPPDAVEKIVGNSGRIPTPPASVAAGIPHDLLRRRPDVREAGLTAASMSARIGVAYADLLPSFSLNGYFGYMGGSETVSLGNLFNWQQTLANAAGSLVVPILNYGRLTNQVRVSDAKFQEAVFNYQSVVLQAQREVADALSSFTQTRRRAGHLETAVDAAKRAVETANKQYELGSADFTRVLTAEGQQLRVEDQLAETQGLAASSWIAVYRALGGGWTLRRSGGVIAPSTREQMENRTNWGNLLETSRHLPPDA